MKILTKVMDLLALSVILSFMILMFSGCQMASGTLSEKEITVFNTEFFNGDITNMNNMLLLQIPLHRITDSASNGSVFPVVTEHFSASSDHAFL